MKISTTLTCWPTGSVRGISPFGPRKPLTLPGDVGNAGCRFRMLESGDAGWKNVRDDNCLEMPKSEISNPLNAATREGNEI